MTSTHKHTSVYSARIADVEDYNIIAGFIAADWQKTPIGKWVVENCEDKKLTFHISHDPYTYSMKLEISAKLNEENRTYFYLKWK